ncbi:uncharacterized protein LOC116700892 [Etheostoma spectabile]|nr:uncharacterized protein LOC116700892 [Etheostoma spectabile]
MSEPVPLPHSARGRVACHAQRWKELKVDISSPCNKTKPDFKQNGQCECSQSSDMTPGTGWDMDKSSCNHLPASVNASANSSLDLLRIVKHKPSTIVFCDNDCSTDNQDIPDAGESSSSITEEREGGDNDDEEDDFPEKLQYKEFLVSRRRRNLSRNRKYSRKRQDAQPNSAASGWQKPTNKGKPEFAGSQREEETTQNNEKQAAACESMTLMMKKLDNLNEPIQEGQSADSSHPDVANADAEQQSTMGDPAVGRASDKPEPLTRRRSQPLTRSRPLTRSSLSSPTHLHARRARAAARMTSGSAG